MRQRKMLWIGITLATLLVWAAPGTRAQETPTARKSQTPAKATAKDASKPAAGAVPATQKKPAAPASGAATTPIPAPAKATKPAKNSAAGTISGTARTPATVKSAVMPPKGAGPGSNSSKSEAGMRPAKVVTKDASKASASTSAKTVQKASATSQATSQPKQSSGKRRSDSTAKPQEVHMARRDPFESLVGRQKEGDSGPKLPGKAGLIISSLRLDGIVRSPNARIAVVSNAQQRTYFLREGDQLYDGRVEKISMDGVSFHEIGKDAFGKPVEHQVNKRIQPSSGEQQ